MSRRIRVPLAMAALLVASVAIVDARPSTSRGWQLLSVSQAECMARADAAFRAEGWSGVTAAGGYVLAFKDIHSGVITCDLAPSNQVVVNVFVASDATDGGVPGLQREQLQRRMATPLAGGGPPGAGDRPAGAGPVGASWGTQADAWRGQNGQRQTLICPPGGPPSSRLWGTDVYTDDSSICTAAVHAGLITVASGGTVAIEIRPGQSSYAGTARNGVSSQGYGSWSGSFVFAGAGPPAGPGSAGPAAGGVCANPLTLAVMDEWLGRAAPPQQPGESLRYEAWGRLVGRSRTATITVSGPPDTRMSRCEWLWYYSAALRSTNGLGTLREYLEQRLR